jgi:ATP-dependent DNA ligase
VFLYAFDLLALNGRDLRHEPIEARKAEFAGVLEHNSGVVFVKVLAQMQAGLGAAAN